MKFILPIAISISILFGLVTVNFSMDMKNLAAKFTTAEIRQVKAGMTLENIHGILNLTTFKTANNEMQISSLDSVSTNKLPYCTCANG